MSLEQRFDNEPSPFAVPACAALTVMFGSIAGKMWGYFPEFVEKHGPITIGLYSVGATIPTIAAIATGLAGIQVYLYYERRR